MRFLTSKQLDKYEDKVKQSCLKCGLDRYCESPKMNVSGKGLTNTLIIGDYPGEQDDQLGKPFMGNANIDFKNIL